MINLSTYILLSLSFILISPAFSQQAPNIILTDVEGNKHELYDALGQGYIVFLDFSFIECAPCNEALHEIKSIIEDFNDQNLLVWYASDRDSDLALKNFLDTAELEVIAAGGEGGVEEALDIFSQDFPFFGFPTISVICPDRSMVWDIWPYTEGAPEWRQTILDCQPNMPEEEYIPIEWVTSNFSPPSPYFEARISPMPFPGKGTLHLSLEESGRVHARLLSTNGLLIKEALNVYMPDGEHVLPLQLEGVPSGLYLLQMTVGHRSNYLKVVLQK